jgi:hypothetical protein
MDESSAADGGRRPSDKSQADGQCKISAKISALRRGEHRKKKKKKKKKKIRLKKIKKKTFLWVV